MEITPLDRENAKKVLANFRAKKTEAEMFYSLCFALLSPQTTFKSNSKVMEELVKRGFFYKDSIDKPTLLKILKPVRFYNNKTNWLVEMKRHWEAYSAPFLNFPAWDSNTAREYLVGNVKGLGYKTASMFLRDIGYTDLAIIDTHILKYLKEKPPTNKKQYLRLEILFNSCAAASGMTPAELDVIVWMKYSNTPWEKVVY